MNRERLIAVMLELLRRVLDEHAVHGHTVAAAPDLPLVGDDSPLSSMALVSFIADVENALARRFAVELVLVNEKALSRKNSPFLTLQTLADYILEISPVGAPGSTVREGFPPPDFARAGDSTTASPASFTP